MTASGRLAGKTALITGIAGGQGREAALRFAAEGATVVGCDIATEGTLETATLVRATGGTILASAPVDLSDDGAVATWIAEAIAAFGGFDILYNNAGAARFGGIEEMSLEDWAFTLRNELDVVFLACRNAWRTLIQRGGGSIINVASVAGLQGNPTNPSSAHSAAKGGVLALTRQLSVEGGPHGIRANAISPGMIVSPATEAQLFNSPEFTALHPNFVEDLLDQSSIKRLGRPIDVVNSAVFLASDESSFITGANLVVDAGRVAR